MNELEKFQSDRYKAELVNRPTMLWSSLYYDGPLSGVLLYNNDLCWFDNFDITNDERTYHYAIHELSKEEKKYELESYYHFRKFFGKHNDLSIDDWYINHWFLRLEFWPRNVETKEEYESIFEEKWDIVDTFSFEYRRNKIIGRFTW